MNIQKISVEKLKPTEYNPRKDLQPEDEEYQKIKKSLVEFGYVAPVIVNADMTVIGGHQRLKVLKELGYTEIECNVVELDKDKEKALNLALNKITGEWDNTKLEELLAELKETDIDMDMTGFSFDEVDNMLKDITGSKEDDFEVDKELEKIKEPVTQLGDVWILGRHRLVCGDSTNQENVKTLMNDREADMILTDPPYNVDLGAINKAKVTLAPNRYKGANTSDIKNDKMDNEKFIEFLTLAFKNINRCLKEGRAFYIFQSATCTYEFLEAMKKAELKLRQQLIWVKNSLCLGLSDYQWRHEPVLYGWKEGAAHYFINNRKETTVLEFDKPTKNEEHPTMKPVDLLCRLIKNSSKENDIILDLFGGSGSTLIAAEQTQRICYMMELDPKYCDVIVKRWETLTNQEATLDMR